jgi:hypothetical protein
VLTILHMRLTTDIKISRQEEKEGSLQHRVGYLGCNSVSLSDPPRMQPSFGMTRLQAQAKRPEGQTLKKLVMKTTCCRREII